MFSEQDFRPIYVIPQLLLLLQISVQRRIFLI